MGKPSKKPSKKAAKGSIRVTGDLVLDTSAVVAALRGVAGGEATLDQAERLWLPLNALGELELGVELASNSGTQRAALDACGHANPKKRPVDCSPRRPIIYAFHV
jgi:hypothetical protein